jgi:hypothetical protein
VAGRAGSPLPLALRDPDQRQARGRTGNWFLENDLTIARLDKLSRNEDVQEKLSALDCRNDLIVCDEAHKLSSTFFGGEVKYTKRHRLGQLFSGLTRHFLLMTATPHNGKEEDFQLFLALLDGNRFEGKYRDGVHHLRPDAPHGQGEPAQVRWHAALPRAHCLHGSVQALRRRGAPL